MDVELAIGSAYLAIVCAIAAAVSWADAKASVRGQGRPLGPAGLIVWWVAWVSVGIAAIITPIWVVSELVE